MKYLSEIKINFRGGIISPGDLLQILQVVEAIGISNVSFGLRQQLIIQATSTEAVILTEALHKLNIACQYKSDEFPNVVSSYPAEEIFIHKTWLSEGVYKDIFDLMDYEPTLKVNISDSNQSFTPLLTGNINWVASLTNTHFWHLFIRFPKTNLIYEWNQLVYTNDVARMTKKIEKIILQEKDKYFDNKQANGEELMTSIVKDQYIIKAADAPAQLPQFNLPYYEGLNRYFDKSWLGIYRRDELFDVKFLKELCQLCLDTKIGQIGATPWKTLMVKRIEEKDRIHWNRLLAKHEINVRHAANELNFQVEDCCSEGLDLKKYLVKEFTKEDLRTFGVCFGIKTRSKSEVFSSILIKRKPLIKIGKFGCFYLYDILCAKEFNPNERTGFVFSSNNPKFVLGEQLRRAMIAFSNQQNKQQATIANHKELVLQKEEEKVFQCKTCLSVYDEIVGDPIQNIPAKTAFKDLSEKYTCNICDSGKDNFMEVEKSKLFVEA